MTTPTSAGDDRARPPRRIVRLGHLALRVPDLARAVEFYTRAVRLAVAEEAEGSVYLRAQFEHHCLELHPSDRPGVLHLGWETDSDDATLALAAALRARGVPVRAAPDEPGRLGAAFQFQDPLGMWNEVYRATARLPVLVPEGPAPRLRLAHVTRMSPAPDDDLAFFRAIGFRVSDWVPGVQAFLRCGTEHHAVGFLKYDRPLLHHHAYDVGGWSSIKAVMDGLAAQGWPVEVGPVRHAAGNNIAVYVRDPNGVRVEFFCEMETIADDEDHEARRQPVVFDLWRQSGPPAGFRE
ncbi:MAG: VOC family protein [Armatimonadota bacterium]|nr:VOC family protein [Armatimonadota bacterium]MDR7532671.1 VOC family protein [Armatimonadota bacterium]MDR7536322.1 VOC family protein [Armatimonadota bacterium]